MSTISRDRVERLLAVAAQRPVLNPDHTPEQSVTAMREQLRTMTGPESAALLTNAWRTAPFPPELRLIDARTANGLRRLARDKAILGLGVSREDTIAHVERWLQQPRTVAETQATYNQDWRTLVPHPDGKTALPLDAIDGIGTVQFSEGHYAIFVPTTPAGLEPVAPTSDATTHVASVLRFYRIYRPTSGANQGVLSIRRYASSNEQAITPAEARHVVAAINLDPDAAAFRYSDQYANCWVCGRSLTDAVSRLLSVGPVCRGFDQHQGLRDAGNEVDRNPERRTVYRALRDWALDQGFTDPRTKEQRQTKRITASCVASAWSGIPGVLALGVEAAVETVKQALTADTVPAPLAQALHEAPADTVCILIDAGVLSQELFTLLLQHPQEAVRKRATQHFTDLLSTT